MDIHEIIQSRRSIRRYLDKPVEKEKMDRLLDAFLWAPSAGNLQMRKFFVVTSLITKQRLAKAALNQTFIADAPAVFICCTDNNIGVKYGDRGVNLYAVQDVSASIMCMMLAAHGMGLGTVWVGAFNESEVFDILDLPNYLRPISLVPVGYPAKVPVNAPKRVDVTEAVKFL